MTAAGALQTPPLLRRSGLGGHPRLGRNLSVHPATSVAGRFTEPVTAWQGVLQSAGIEELHDRGVLIEATASPPGMGSFVLPGLGRELRRELEDADHLATLGAMIADRPSGRVQGRDRTLVRYDLDPRDGDRLMTAVRAMGRLLFAAGAEEILTGVPAPRAPARWRNSTTCSPGSPPATCISRRSTPPAQPPPAPTRSAPPPTPRADSAAPTESSSRTPRPCPAARRSTPS